MTTKTDQEIKADLQEQITSHRIVLFMKGDPDRPQCGFSQRASQILDAIGEPWAWVDILSEPDTRRMLPQVSDWPTFPQLFVDGELIGGSDIMLEMYQNGELKGVIAKQDEDTTA